ncbi:MAG TPA: SusE domain-containing protein [Cyclobacteriaceae bacterium]|nr:SusE domain-containing protein [Cyclobacteriaceae bacterium]
MKKIFMIMLGIVLVAFTNSCQDSENNPQFPKSDADFSVTASATTISVSPQDSLSVAVTFTWTDPKFAVGLSNSDFTVMFGPTDKNFISFSSKDFTGILTGSLTGKEVNALALKFGGAIGEPIVLDMRVVASHNNNEPKISNIVKITVTPFSDLALLSSSATVVTKEADAAKVGISFNWNAPFVGYEGTRTYQFQYAEGGTSFASPKSIAVSVLNKSFTQLELNNIAALEFGTLAGEVGNVDFRVKCTNGLGAIIYSNTVTVGITPYSSKPVPKYPVPDNLFLVGDASPGGWSNPVPTPSQQFTKINDYTFGLVIQLTGGKSYLALPVNGDWSHKYNPSISNADPAGDAFAPDAGGNNIPGPAADGLYKIVIDFVAGTYTTTLLSASPVPANLYIVGDATAGVWANPVPVPSQQFTQISNAEFELTIDLTASKSYLLLPVNGDWGHKYGGTSKTGSDLLVDGDVPGSNTPSPDASGTYTINVNFLTMQYTVKQ